MISVINVVTSLVIETDGGYLAKYAPVKYRTTNQRMLLPPSGFSVVANGRNVRQSENSRKFRKSK